MEVTAKKVILKNTNKEYLIPYVNPASTTELGTVKIDGETIQISDEGVISAQTHIIGEIISMNCSSSYVPDGCLPCDGAEYSKAQFNDLWENYLTSEDVSYTLDNRLILGENTNTTIENGIISELPTVSFDEPISIGKEIVLNYINNDIQTTQYLFGIYGYHYYLAIIDGKIGITSDTNSNINSVFGNIFEVTQNNFFIKIKGYDAGSGLIRWKISLSYDGIDYDTQVIYDSSGYEDIIYFRDCKGQIDLTQSYFSPDGITKDYLCVKKVNSLLNVCSYLEYGQDLANYEQCAKFAVDVDNEKFRVPLIKDGAVIQQALTFDELGKAYNAGLPNIEGTFKADRHTAYQPTGAFYLYDDSGATGADDTGTSNSRIHGFDASLSNSIYGNSDTVQMNAVALRYFVVVANGQTNQSMMDWSAWASNLQGKANVDLSNVDKVSLLGLRKLIEVSDPALMPSWYKVFEEIQPDGSIKKWCEQGFTNTGSGLDGSQTFTFLKEFADLSYEIFKNHSSSSSSNPSARAMSFYNKTTTSATTYTFNDGASWFARGYIKE